MELQDALFILKNFVEDSTAPGLETLKAFRVIRTEMVRLQESNETLRTNAAGQEAVIEMLNNDLLTRYGEYHGRSKVLHKIMHLAINELGYELKTED